MSIKTVIISGFPGIGKSYFYNNNHKTLKISDSDSSRFDKKDFPNNYIKHIKKLIKEGDYDFILVYSHKEVREEMIKNKIDFMLVYPEKYLKKSYIERYKERGSPEAFINMMEEKFESFVNECENTTSDFVTKISLKVPSETLNDVIQAI